MSELQIIVLGVVQGLSEFLPISSSGHLILVPILAGWPDQGLVVDVAVHIGSLGAVLLYFRAELWSMLRGLASWRSEARDVRQGRQLLALIAVGTLPIVIVGFALRSFGGDGLRSAVVVGWTSILFGSLLFIADGFGPRRRSLHQLGFSDALIIGAAQALALIPGTSRSGVTMTAARCLGVERPDAARFSFLLSIPATLAAGTLVGLEMIQAGRMLDHHVLLGVLAALISAWAAIAFLMRWLQRSTFTPFVLYRWLLGLILLTYGYGLGIGLALLTVAGLFAWLVVRPLGGRRQDRVTWVGSPR